MARASRQGVDYFPLNVYLDNKFKILEAKHGLSGFAVAIKLMQNVYAEGYWLEFGDDERFLFASDNRIDQVEFDSILETCLEKGIFNKEMFKKYNILTSRGIQKQYKEMTKRRKEVDVVEDYLLCVDLMNAQCKQDVDTMHSNKHNMNAQCKQDVDTMHSNKSPQNSNSPHSDNKSTQTETETETEIETETETEIETDSNAATDNNIFREYEKAGFGIASSTQAEMLMELEKNYGYEWTVDALKESAKNNVLKISYAEAILKNWATNGRSKNESGRKNTGDHQKQERSYATEVNLDDYDESLFDGLI